MRTYANLGPVISDTFLPEDLIPAFMEALDDIRERITENDDDPTAVSSIDNLLGEIEQHRGTGDDDLVAYFESAQSILDVELLIEKLNEHASPYAWFGASEGDGACFGFWLSMESVEEDVLNGNVIKVNAGDAWPEDEITERLGAGVLDYVLEVNDHGNATLYTPDHAVVWSVV